MLMDRIVGCFWCGRVRVWVGLVVAVVVVGLAPCSAAGYVTAPATIFTIAGTPLTFCSVSPCGDGGAATSAQLNLPTGVAVDAAGDMLIADRGDHVVRRVDHVTGVITTIAG